MVSWHLWRPQVIFQPIFAEQFSPSAQLSARAPAVKICKDEVSSECMATVPDSQEVKVVCMGLRPVVRGWMWNFIVKISSTGSGSKGL